MSVKEGDVVAVHYTGRLDSGEVFDTSEGTGPLEFRVGGNQVIDGFERAVRGLGPGEARTVRIPPEEAYGPKRPDLVVPLDRKLFEEAQDVEVGQRVDVEDEAGNSYPAEVVSFDDQTVTVDLNHPLAGEALTFDIKVLDVRAE